MAALSPYQLAQLVSGVLRDGQINSGGTIWETAYAVARAESGGRPEAIGDGGNSFGLWQIYVPAHPQWSGSWLMTPSNNAGAMVALSGGGYDWTPWCTWDRPACGGAGNGSYRAYLEEARAAFAAFRSSPPAPPAPPPGSPPTGDAQFAAGWLLLAGGGALLAWAASKKG